MPKTRKSKIKAVIVHKVKTDNYDAKMSELAKIHSDIIKRRLCDLNASSDVKILIIENIMAKLRAAE